MLKPAQLYKSELQKKNIESWYKPENIFWHGGTAEYSIELPDNNGEVHCFVSIDKKDSILGYISYDIDWQARSAYQWGIISFCKGSIEFARDLYQAIRDCFEVYHLNKIGLLCGQSCHKRVQEFYKKAWRMRVRLSQAGYNA